MEQGQRDKVYLSQKRLATRLLNRKRLGHAHLNISAVLLDYCSKSKDLIKVSAEQEPPRNAQDASHYTQCIPYMREPKNSFHHAIFGSLASLEMASAFPESLPPKTQSHHVLLEDSFMSPFTGRQLKTRLFSDHACRPLKLSILLDIVSKYQAKHPWETACSSYTRSSIDYVRVRAELLPQINAFLSDFFWPGIDVKDALNYPDYSIVAMYKRKVIGVALMTPVCYITYFLVHPDWQRASIGSTMLFHLILVAPLSDMTLHVPATSGSAMILYQSFGFKAEEFVLNFYKKYMPPETHSSGLHALALRLRK